MTTIAITVFPDAEKWLREYVPLMAGDRVCIVRPVGAFNPDGTTPYEDIEDGTSKECSFADHVRALELLSGMVGQTLFVGGVKGAHQLTDFGNWDVEVVDAFWQLVYRGEVLYG